MTKLLKSIWVWIAVHFFLLLSCLTSICWKCTKWAGKASDGVWGNKQSLILEQWCRMCDMSSHFSNPTFTSSLFACLSINIPQRGKGQILQGNETENQNSQSERHLSWEQEDWVPHYYSYLPSKCIKRSPQKLGNDIPAPPWCCASLPSHYSAQAAELIALTEVRCLKKIS